MSDASAWAAPTPESPVVARVQMPGTKSGTNRYFVLAAQSTRSVRISKPLWARDTTLMAEGLRNLGVKVVVEEDGTAVITGPDAGGQIGDPRNRVVDCGLAGTVARFLPPFAALVHSPSEFDGDPRMRERPMGPLLDALETLGATVSRNAIGSLPMSVKGPLRGGEVEIDASQSSQLVSGLLLSGPSMTNGVTVRHVGEPIPSMPHIDMTVEALRRAGAEVTVGENEWTVAPGPLTLPDTTIETDLSTASAFLAAAAVTAGTVTMEDWPLDTTQPGKQLPELLTAFGCTVEVVTTETGADLVVKGPDELQGIDVDLHEYGESAATFTALAVLAKTPTRLRGIAHLRGHETDRLAALAEELGKLGADITVEDDGLSIRPAPLASTSAVLNPRADHRLAMAYAVVGLVIPGVLVSDIATTSKTISDFEARWHAMLAPSTGGK